jgi:uncharacterized membrane protein YgdD (TMEM256/DUF423 family)
MTTQQKILALAAVLGFLAVALGAFGAHALKPTLLANNRLDTFELAVRYHFYHALAILAIGILIHQFPGNITAMAAYSMALGVLLFSGSLYLMAIANTTKVAFITPIGGVFFLVGWGLLIYGSCKGRTF